VNGEWRIILYPKPGCKFLLGKISHHFNLYLRNIDFSDKFSPNTNVVVYNESEFVPNGLKNWLSLIFKILMGYLHSVFVCTIYHSLFTIYEAMMTTRVALITGGLCTAICKALADAGYLVVANCSSDDKDWQAKRFEEGFDFTIARGNVADFDAATMVKEVEAQFERIDVLVKCAGITKNNFIHKIKPQWNNVLRTNLDSIFNVTKPVTKMRYRRFGRIMKYPVNEWPSIPNRTNQLLGKSGYAWLYHGTGS